jgi:hypothetical protein
MLRIFAEELDDKGHSTGERTDVDVAIIIDDLINHKPQFLQNRYTGLGLK